MERSLNPDLLALALGDHERLPSVEEFTDALETAELGILQGEERLADTVFPTAWLLHAIASSDEATRLYGENRQRAAFRVSAHAFDLILQQDERDWIDRAQLCFAAQIAYLRSKFDPNAVAVYERELSSDLADPDILRNPTRYSLSCATALLAFDTDYLFEATADIRERLDAVAEQFSVNRIGETPFGAAGNLIAGCRHLLVFLVYGREERLNGARTRFRQAIHSDGATGDRPSRWAAAHLLNLLRSGLADKSIWSVLPPDVPPSIRRAFTLAPPKVLTLWPPQLDLLSPEDEDEERSPFSADNDRQLITMPTSGGKTLFSHLIIAVQLARTETDVCYVAPTRSLCREVRRDLNKRLRFVSRTGADHSQKWLDTELSTEGESDVEVMTPERLSYLLRGDAQAVLDRFGLFVFDEVHTVDDDERGWTLEQDLSYLHHATQNTDHRILLMSAAVGNQPHFVDWMGGEPHVSQSDSEWQATRRVHSIYTTELQRQEEETEERQSEDYPTRRIIPLEGVWWIRGAEGSRHEITFGENVGQLALKESDGGRRQKEYRNSTPNYRTLTPLVNRLAELGPVLVIQSTKQRARRTAETLSESQSDHQELPPDLVQLIELVNTRLGADHPLSEVLDRGVAYHHGKLPSEIRNGIEDAVSSEALQYVVATTTMTEGVNLPVKSVVVASQGAYGADGFDEYIVGSRLLNAIGRAGRAAKETEGIVVLARFTRNPEEDFDRLDPDREELRADSWLAKPEALENLAQFEEMAREAEDVVMQAGADTETDAVSSFLSFVWFIAAELERLERPRTPEEVAEWLQSTLAWVQLDEETQERWSRVAEQALERYQETDVASRRRWARSGTSVNTAARLDDLAEEVAEKLTATEDEITSLTDLIMFLLSDGRLSRILEASDSSGIEVRSRRARGGEEINLDLLALVRDWLEGAELNSIAGDYLADVDQTNYRFEQLGELIYEVFEIHLPWMLRVLVDWTNEHLEARNLSPALPDEIPSLVRWGVPDLTAAKLMNRGIGSRRLAIQITEEWREADPEVGVEEWVRNLPRSDWRERFDATVAELRNLVSILRPRSDDTLLPFLSGESITVPIQKIEEGEIEMGEGVEVPQPSEEWAPIEITQGGESVGTVEGSHTQDVMAILQMGVRLSTEIDLVDGSPSLRLSPLEPQQPVG
jgi:replicative superfamily II helicase